MKRLLPLLLALVIAGCASAPSMSEWSAEKAGPLPDDAHLLALVNAHIAATFKDPYTVRDLSLGDVKPAVVHQGMGRGTFIGYKVFYSCNAKNSYGAYIGIRTMSFYVQNGQDFGEAL